MGHRINPISASSPAPTMSSRLSTLKQDVPDILSILEASRVGGPLTAKELAAARTQRAQLAGLPGMEPTDYAKYLAQTQETSKLQLALAMAQAGFTAAGTPPREGEWALTTLGRGLAPLAPQVGEVAANLQKQKMALELAKKAEEKEVTLAAYSDILAGKRTREGHAMDLVKAELARKAQAGSIVKVDDIVSYDSKTKKYGKPLVSFFHKGDQQLRDVGGRDLYLRDVKDADGNIIHHQNAAPALDTEGLKETLQTQDYKLYHTTGSDEGSVYKVGGVTPLYKVINKGDDIGKFREVGAGTILSSKELADKGLEARKVTDTTGKATGAKLEEEKAAERYNNFIRNLPFLFDKHQYKSVAGLRINPRIHPASPGLKYFDIIEQEGPREGKPRELTNNERKVIDANLRSTLRLSEITIKAGKDYAALAPQYAKIFADKTLSDFGIGLPEAKRVTSYNAQLSQLNKGEQVFTDEGADIKEVPPAAFIPKNWTPRSQEMLNSIRGRAALSVNLVRDLFDKNSMNPESLERPASGQKLEGFNSNIVQQRLDLEAAVADRSIHIDIGQFPSPGMQLGKIQDRKAEIQAARRKRQDDPKSQKFASELATKLQTLRMLKDFTKTAVESGALGFVTGPLSKFAVTSIPFSEYVESLSTEESRKMFAQLNYFDNILGRQLAKAAGEQRITEQDLKGMKTLTPTAGKPESFTAAKIRLLMDHLQRNIQNDLQSLGSFEFSDENLRLAVELGVNLPGKTKHNYFTPWVGQTYPAFRQAQPQYSPQEMEQVRQEGVLKFFEGTKTGAKKYPEPVHDDEGKFLRNIWVKRKALLADKPRLRKLVKYYKDILRFKRQN